MITFGNYVLQLQYHGHNFYRVWEHQYNCHENIQQHVLNFVLHWDLNREKFKMRSPAELLIKITTDIINIRTVLLITTF